MTQIAAFDSDNIKTLREDIEAALAGVAAKHGIKSDLGRITYNPTSLKVTLEMAVIGTDGVAVTQKAKAFKNYAEMYGLKAEDLGIEFELKVKGGTTETFKITGLNTRAKAYPIEAINIKTKAEIMLPVTTVQKVLGRKVEARTL